MATSEPTPVLLSDHGELVAAISDESARFPNYTVKRDWRRELDREIRREGDELFVPDTDQGIGNQPYPNFPSTTAPITLVHLARRPNGEHAIIVGTDAKLWRYFAMEDARYMEDTGTNTPYFDDTTPDGVYMSDINGEWLTIWETQSGTSGKRWQAENLNGYVVFNNQQDIPFTYRIEEYEVEPIWELREQGIAEVGTICVYGNFLVLGDVEEIKEDELTGIMNGADPYGPVHTSLTNRIGYRVMWSGAGEPRRWASNVQVEVNEGSRQAWSAYPMESLNAGDAVVVVGGAADGGNLYTTIINRTDLSLPPPLDDLFPELHNGTTYHLADVCSNSSTAALLMRADATALGVDAYDLQDDGTRILTMSQLEDYLYIFKDTSVFLAYYSGTWGFDRVYVGNAVPIFPNAVIVDEAAKRLLYPSRDTFYSIDLVTRTPKVDLKLHMAKDIFYDNVDTSVVDDVWAAHSTVTHELIWKLPAGDDDKLFCYDYTYQRCSSSSLDITGGATVKRPVVGAQTGASEDWLVMGTSNGTVLKYGRTFWSDPIYTRIDSDGNEVTYPSVLRFGYYGHDFYETELVSVAIVPGSRGDNTPATVRLYGGNGPDNLELLGQDVLLSPISKNTIATYLLHNLFQMEVEVVDEETPLSLIRVLWDARVVDGGRLVSQ